MKEWGGRADNNKREVVRGKDLCVRCDFDRASEPRRWQHDADDGRRMVMRRSRGVGRSADGHYLYEPKIRQNRWRRGGLVVDKQGNGDRTQ